MSQRKVKGVLFVDYVRMLKSRKDVDWSKHLDPADMVYLSARIEDSEWYPMETFERMGLAILDQIATGNLDLVRIWGCGSIDTLTQKFDSLVCDKDPLETLMRFQVVRRSLFDFSPVEAVTIAGNSAKFKINYGMGKRAEEAASWQAVGFFQRLLEKAGATNIQYEFPKKHWKGDPESILDLNWSEAAYGKKVKGILFVDYVRMIKSKKELDWHMYLKPMDLTYLKERIDDEAWYPMETFERMGVAILRLMALGNIDLVRLWGRLSVEDLIKTHGTLVIEGDPMESLMRFQVLRRSFFNFEAIYLEYISSDYAKLEICYDMGNEAEEAATYQSLGFFERLLEVSGAKDINFKFTSKLWEGDPTTILEISWN